MKSPAYGNTLDTVANSGTKYLVIQTVGAPSALGIAVTLTKISGTAGGSAILQSSNDGTNYFTVKGADTLSVSNVTTQSYGWTVSAPGFAYYRVSYTGTGSMSVQIKGYALLRKQ